MFSTPMVQAILNGTKTQTRRIVKGVSPNFYANVEKFCKGEAVNSSDLTHDDLAMDELLEKCPYGKVGDILWVKETFYAYGTWLKYFNTETKKYKWEFSDRSVDYLYNDSKPKEIKNKNSVDHGCHKRPSLFMPKGASRIWLQITDIRVERLLDISEEDAIAEGIEVIIKPGWHNHYKDYMGEPDDDFVYPQNSYYSLWNSINGKDSHKINPWVWVIQFENIGFEKAAMLLTHGEKAFK